MRVDGCWRSVEAKTDALRVVVRVEGVSMSGTVGRSCQGLRGVYAHCWQGFVLLVPEIDQDRS